MYSPCNVWKDKICFSPIYERSGHVKWTVYEGISALQYYGDGASAILDEKEQIAGYWNRIAMQLTDCDILYDHWHSYKIEPMCNPGSPASFVFILFWPFGTHFQRGEGTPKISTETDLCSSQLRKLEFPNTWYGIFRRFGQVNIFFV